ncbi:regulator of G-protein signaling 7 [Teleopsis dalmanni]|uniref:regulator of G-protein signaling 7 n=2 Tax=Teleopsis dalmanni TaxID=139649 RepID=UPI0018CD2DF3|nr:regulator of G-protein signaling 7 [Teleopsis dalmanni]
MVTMTSEVDKTQTSKATMASKPNASTTFTSTVTIEHTNGNAITDDVNTTITNATVNQSAITTTITTTNTLTTTVTETETATTITNNGTIGTNANNTTTNSACTSNTNSTGSVSVTVPTGTLGTASSATASGSRAGGVSGVSGIYSIESDSQTLKAPSHSAGGSKALHSNAKTTPSTVPPPPNQYKKSEDSPNVLVYKKMESIIEKMQAESTGVTVRTVKAFMSKVPSVFTGADLIAWILKNFDVDDVTEALHFAHLLASHGYIFPIDDHQLTVKNDGTFYRFQTPYFWPSNCWEPENTDYAVYLCKRTMQNKTRLELADYEAENLAKLQKMFSRKWEFIFMQAESQSKVAKKRDKLERKVLDSQERAFWDVHRPMPGCVNTTEIDIKKAYRRGASSHGTGSAGASVAKNPVEQLTRIIALRKQKLERRTIKVSKAAEALVAYYEQYNEFDYFITSTELPNPWQTDSTEMWDTEKNTKEVPLRRVKRWGFSLRELLNDPIGREQFTKFLEKEYSGENLKFWESVQEMKALPQSEIKEAIQNIWQEYLAPEAPCPVNVDSKSVELAREAVNQISPNGPNRWCFDVAASHVYHLMKSDSYSRYLRSEMYKDYLNCSRKKIKSIPNLFGVKR